MGCSASLDNTAHLVRLANDAKSQKEAGGPSGWSHDSGMSDSSFMPSQIPTIIVTPPSVLPPKDATRHAAATTLAPPDAGGTPRKVGQGGVTHPAATAYVVSPAAYSVAVAMDAAKRHSARPPPLSAVATGGGLKTLPSRDSHSSVGARDDGTASNPSSPHGFSSTRTMATGAGGYPCSPTSHARDSGLTGSDIYGDGLQQAQDPLRRRSTTGTDHGGGGPSFSSASIVYKSGPPLCAAVANGRTSETSSGGSLKSGPPSISLPGVNRRSSDGSGSIGALGLTAKPAMGKPKSLTSPSSSLSVHAAIATANRVNSLAGGMKHIIPQPRMSAQQQQQQQHHHHHHHHHVDAPESPSVKPRDVSGDQPRQYQQHHHHHRSHHHLATDDGGHRGSCDGVDSFHGHRHTGVDGDHHHRCTPTGDEEDEAEAVFRFRDDDTIEREQLKIDGIEETPDDTPVIRPTRATSLPVKGGDSPPPLRTGSGGADTPTNFAIEQVMGRGLGTSTKSSTEANLPPRAFTPPMDRPAKSATSPEPLLDHRLPSLPTVHHHHKHESFDQSQSPDSSYSSSSAAASLASDGHVRNESTTADHRRHASTTEIAAH